MVSGPDKEDVEGPYLSGIAIAPEREPEVTFGGRERLRPGSEVYLVLLCFIMSTGLDMRA